MSRFNVTGFNKAGLRREKLSIGLIGKHRFYMGLFAGLTLGISLYMLFAVLREVLRSASVDTDLLIPPETDFIIYNSFFAGISLAFGFGVTIWIWFYGLFNGKRTPIRISYIGTYGLIGPMIVLSLILKFMPRLTWVLSVSEEYYNHLNLARDFPQLLLLLPLVTFLNIWSPVRTLYRTGAWLTKSLVGFLILTVLLGFNSPIDQSKLNKIWYNYMVPYNEIVDKEINRANALGVTFSQTAIETIRFNKKKIVSVQADNLRHRFASTRPIPLDTVILELIVIKKAALVFSRNTRYEHDADQWPFARPKHIFRQMNLTNDPIMKGYLLEIIAEYDSMATETFDPYTYVPVDMLTNDSLSDAEYAHYRLIDAYIDIFIELFIIRKESREIKSSNDL